MGLHENPQSAEFLTVSSDTAANYICVRIFGGLGNQMFQYAAGFAQAQRLKRELVLHVAPKGAADHAAFGLDCFPISPRIWDETKSASVLGRLFGDRLSGDKKRRKTGEHWPGPRFEHSGLEYKSAINEIVPGTHLLGYFQSENYFAEVSDEVRRLFSLAAYEPKITGSVKSIFETATPTLSVHIRRGDYAKDKKVKDVHGLLDERYYEQALALMRQIHGDIHVLVFSDNLEAADTLTMNWPNRTLVDQNDRLLDLCAMSLCNHHIIANSSFSWWGAWLNPAPSKTVIAPRQWFTPEALKTHYMHDLCPRGWILI